MLGRRRWGRGAALQRHARGQSYRAGQQQCGGVLEEGSEEARDLLKLLADSSDLTGEDAHLGKRKLESPSHHCHTSKDAGI